MKKIILVAIGLVSLSSQVEAQDVSPVMTGEEVRVLAGRALEAPASRFTSKLIERTSDEDTTAIKMRLEFSNGGKRYIFYVNLSGEAGISILRGIEGELTYTPEYVADRNMDGAVDHGFRGIMEKLFQADTGSGKVIKGEENRANWQQMYNEGLQALRAVIQ